MMVAFEFEKACIVYQRSRFYNPQQGRLLTFDSYAGDVREPKSLHKYLYAEGDPVNGIDPSGQMTLASGLGTLGAFSIGIATALPAIRGAWNSAYHAASNGQRESLFAATFNGTATWQDFRRIFTGFGSGASAGAYNALDTLTFRQINPLNEYASGLWAQEKLDESWVGTASNVFAWTGTAALYSAAAVWTWSAAGGGTMDIAVSRAAHPYYVHVQYGVNGAWKEGFFYGFRNNAILDVTKVVGTRITEIPVLYPEAVMSAERALSCVTAALRAFGKGWGLP